MSTVAKLDSVSKHLPSEPPSIWSVYFTTSAVSKLDRVSEYLPSGPHWSVYFTMSTVANYKLDSVSNIYQVNFLPFGLSISPRLLFLNWLG